jgi:hypothetical protein
MSLFKSSDNRAGHRIEDLAKNAGMVAKFCDVISFIENAT